MYKDYKANKARLENEKLKKNGDDSESENESKRTPWDVKNDALAQKMCLDEGEVNIEELKTSKTDTKTCEAAPIGNAKPTNFYCMEVVNDNDKVKPFPKKERKPKVIPIDHKIDVRVSPKKKQETKEEKKLRKQKAKEIKHAIKESICII